MKIYQLHQLDLDLFLFCSEFKMWKKNITELIRLQTANEVNENSMKFKGYLGEVEKVKRVMQVMQGIAG